MLIDAPSVEDTGLKPGDTQTELTDENAGDILRMINQFNR